MRLVLRALANAEVSLLVDEALDQLACAHCSAIGLRVGEVQTNGKRAVRCRTCGRSQVEEANV